MAQETEKKRAEFKQHPSEDAHTEGKKFTKDIRRKKEHRESPGPLDGKSESGTEGQVCSRDAQ